MIDWLELIGLVDLVVWARRPWWGRADVLILLLFVLICLYVVLGG